MKADTFDSGILGRRRVFLKAKEGEGESRERLVPMLSRAEATGATGAGSRSSSTDVGLQ